MAGDERPFLSSNLVSRDLTLEAWIARLTFSQRRVEPGAT
jgi:hypothetical protein